MNNNQTYIIAEMAWSHNGKLSNALALLDGAQEAGANAISIHITSMNDYMVKNYKCIAGQTLSADTETNSDDTIFDILNKLNLKQEDWLTFEKKLRKKNIDLLVMANDFPSFQFSKKLSVSAYVLSPASFQEYQLIREITYTKKPIYLRTGGATLNEVQEVVAEIRKHASTVQVILLGGIQLYPTPIQDLRLKSLSTLRNKFKDAYLEFGLADHIDGENPFAKFLPALALCFGATVLEKHITTNREEKLEDYEAALGIKQFKEFVDFIRVAELGIGLPDLEYMDNITGAYKKYREVSRKKIVALKNIKCGEYISKTKFTLKRSDHGLDMSWAHKIINYKATCDMFKDDPILISKIKRIDTE